MRKLLYSAVVLTSLTTISSAQTLTETFGSGANAFTMDFVTIGNPNNSPTTLWSNPVGSVMYSYNLCKYEISRDQVYKANNAGTLGISLFDMGTIGLVEGNGWNRPATGITWYEAAKFVNYLNISQGKQVAYSFDGSGRFQIWGAGQYIGSNQYRHKDAYYFLPSLDEWYKGAYGSSDGTWYTYPNGSNTEPTKVIEGTTGAVYGGDSGPADINNAGGLSPFGTIAQGGNVIEWTESAADSINNEAQELRVYRGGGWNDMSVSLNALGSLSIEPEYDFNFGFRVASIPEPSSLSLLALGGVVMALRRRR